MRGTRLRNYQLILLLFFGFPGLAAAGGENELLGGTGVRAETQAPGAEKPLRVASMNYCIDFVLERWLENEDANFTLFPVAEHQGRIEQMLQIQPDIIIAGQFNSPITLNNFRSHGLPVTVLAEPNSFAQSATFFRELAQALKQPALANRDIAAFSPEKVGSGTAVPDPNFSGPAGNKPTALALQANQWSFGGNNLLNELLEHLGLENLAARNGDGLVRINLEDVIAWQPHILLLDGEVIVTNEAETTISKNSAEETANTGKRATFALAQLNLMHKSLRNYQQRSDVQTIYLPRELSGCMAQRLPEAINVLRYQLQNNTSATENYPGAAQIEFPAINNEPLARNTP